MQVQAMDTRQMAAQSELEFGNKKCLYKYSLKKCCGLMLGRADEHCPQQVCFYDDDNE